MERKDFMVFDLDGTLSNATHRVAFAQAGQWDEFHSLSHLDEPHEEIATLYRLVADKFGIIILTGRNEKYRQLTLRWLYKYGLEPDYLFMRGDDDFQKDTLLKLSMLDNMFGNSREQALERISLIFEDRDQVVEGFRNAGFMCAQVRNGSY